MWLLLLTLDISKRVTEPVSLQIHHRPRFTGVLPTVRIREKEAYLREKGCAVLEKPFLLEDLLERVRAFIGPASEQ